MKTKPFLLATAGSTVDGRTIDEKQITEMASSYNPQTYGARVNIEHMRGITPGKPFCAYGDVVELTVGDVEVDFNGKQEKRKGLFGVLDVSDDAKQLNDAGQKLYPSIEILENFGGKGYAYLAGLALTDSPASIATERLKFNRTLPNAIVLNAEASGIAAAALEPAEAEAATDAAIGAVAGFFTKLTDRLGLNGAPAVSTPAPKADDAPTFDPAQFAKDMKELGETLTGALTQQAATFTAEIGKLTSDLAALKTEVEDTPASGFKARPLSTGGSGADYSKVF